MVTLSLITLTEAIVSRSHVELPASDVVGQGTLAEGARTTKRWMLVFRTEPRLIAAVVVPRQFANTAEALRGVFHSDRVRRRTNVQPQCFRYSTR